MQPVTSDPVVFSAAWFARHQRMLLGVLRTPIIGRELRDALAIRRHDVGWDRRIVRVMPDHYVVRNEDGSFTADFRTHAKFAKRLRHQLDGLWRAAHAWDMHVANPLVPALNVGFDSLSVYPDPGSPGTTSIDGQVYRGFVDESFSAIRNGSGSGTLPTTTVNTAPQLWASSTTDQFQLAQHGVFLFDTSSMGASAVVSTATFSQWFTGVTTNLGDTTVEITGGTTAATTTLAASDYQDIGRTAFASGLTLSGITAGAYTDAALNVTGRAAIATTGITVLETQLGWDLANAFTGTWVSSVATEATVTFADQTGSANDPKLDVTYTIPGILLVKN